MPPYLFNPSIPVKKFNVACPFGKQIQDQAGLGILERPIDRRAAQAGVRSDITNGHAVSPQLPDARPHGVGELGLTALFPRYLHMRRTMRRPVLSKKALPVT